MMTCGYYKPVSFCRAVWGCRRLSAEAVHTASTCHWLTAAVFARPTAGPGPTLLLPCDSGSTHTLRQQSSTPSHQNKIPGHFPDISGAQFTAGLRIYRKGATMITNL